MIRAKNLSLMLVLTLFMTAIAARVRAQEKDAKPADKPVETAPAAPPKEESSVTDHSIKIGGQTIPYKATAATILLKNEKDEPTALLYFTAYTRSDVKDLSQRPVSFVYNGGPGSSSVWLHMGSFSPRRVITANADATPPAPYKLSENPHCLLDKTDLVFLDPVGTGRVMIELKGVVAKLDYVNPHSWLHLTATGPDGNGVSPEQQQARLDLADQIVKRGMSVRQTEVLVNKAVAASAIPARREKSTSSRPPSIIEVTRNSSRDSTIAWSSGSEGSRTSNDAERRRGGLDCRCFRRRRSVRSRRPKRCGMRARH